MSAENQSSIEPLQISRHDVSKRKAEPIKFLMCNSCFWCTSLLSRGSRPAFTHECPCCKSRTIESIPVEPDEFCSIQHDGVSGLVLAFRSSRHGKEVQAS